MTKLISVLFIAVALSKLQGLEYDLNAEVSSIYTNTNIADIIDSKGRTFWDKVMVENPNQCDELKNDYPREYPRYTIFYKPTLLYVLEDTNGDTLELTRITDISIKNDIFAFTMTFLINDRDRAYPHNIAKTDILPIDTEFGQMMQTLKFIDDNVVAFYVNDDGSYPEIQKAYVCDIDIKEFLDR